MCVCAYVDLFASDYCSCFLVLPVCQTVTAIVAIARPMVSLPAANSVFRLSCRAPCNAEEHPR